MVCKARALRDRRDEPQLADELLLMRLRERCEAKPDASNGVQGLRSEKLGDSIWILRFHRGLPAKTIFINFSLILVTDTSPVAHSAGHSPARVFMPSLRDQQSLSGFA